MTQPTTHKRLPVDLTTEYNSSTLIRTLRNAARRACWSPAEIDDMTARLTSIDSNNLWSVAREYCE